MWALENKENTPNYNYVQQNINCRFLREFSCEDIADISMVLISTLSYSWVRIPEVMEIFHNCVELVMLKIINSGSEIL
jgi:hypothetical protein